MAGRPRKPIALKAVEGDRSRIGALRHAEEIAGAFIAKRGRPPFPPSLEEREPATDEQMAAELRRSAARQHWEYLCSTLESDRLLCVHDAGVLEGMCWNHANQMELFAAGEVKLAASLQAEYRSSAIQVGLTESARAKMPKPQGPVYSASHLALVDDLPATA